MMGKSMTGGTIAAWLKRGLAVILLSGALALPSTPAQAQCCGAITSLLSTIAVAIGVVNGSIWAQTFILEEAITRTGTAIIGSIKTASSIRNSATEYSAQATQTTTQAETMASEYYARNIAGPGYNGCVPASGAAALNATPAIASSVARSLEGTPVRNNSGEKAAGATIKEDVAVVKEACATGKISSEDHGSEFYSQMECKEISNEDRHKADVLPEKSIFSKERLCKPENTEMMKFASTGITSAAYQALKPCERDWVDAVQFCMNLAGNSFPSPPRNAAALTPPAMSVIRNNRVAEARLNATLHTCLSEVAYRTAVDPGENAQLKKIVENVQKFMIEGLKKPAEEVASISSYQIDKAYYFDWCASIETNLAIEAGVGEDSMKMNNKLQCLSLMQRWTNANQERVSRVATAVTGMMAAQSSFAAAPLDRPQQGTENLRERDPKKIVGFDDTDSQPLMSMVQSVSETNRVPSELELSLQLP